MISILPYYLLRSLILTIIIECAAALIIGIRDRRDLLTVLLVQVVTNPALVLISFMMNMRFGITGRTTALIILEPAAVIIEGILYRYSIREKRINPYLLSMLLNLISFSIGEVINYFV